MTRRTISDDDYREAARVIDAIEDIEVDSDALDEAEDLLEPLQPALLAAGIDRKAAKALVARGQWVLEELRDGRTPTDDLNPTREAPWLFLTDALIRVVLASLGDVSAPERERRLLELDLDPARAEALRGNRGAEMGGPEEDV